MRSSTTPMMTPRILPMPPTNETSPMTQGRDGVQPHGFKPVFAVFRADARALDEAGEAVHHARQRETRMVVAATFTPETFAASELEPTANICSCRKSSCSRRTTSRR